MFAWWSDKQFDTLQSFCFYSTESDGSRATNCITNFYRTTDGREVEVTEVGDHSNWDDAINLGEVESWVSVGRAHDPLYIIRKLLDQLRNENVDARAAKSA